MTINHAAWRHWPHDKMARGVSSRNDMELDGNWAAATVYLEMETVPGNFQLNTGRGPVESFPTASQTLARMLHLRMEGYTPYDKDLAWLRRRIQEEGCRDYDE